MNILAKNTSFLGSQIPNDSYKSPIKNVASAMYYQVSPKRPRCLKRKYIAIIPQDSPWLLGSVEVSSYLMAAYWTPSILNLNQLTTKSEKQLMFYESMINALINNMDIISITSFGVEVIAALTVQFVYSRTIHPPDITVAQYSDDKYSCVLYLPPMANVQINKKLKRTDIVPVVCNILNNTNTI
ncbi:hypothetical protein AGLY_000183 [Aphis glycines]|uniref:Uncharacterized protein n=1 Tax=Aphis glycines TaxID=307491 RepID=A0A6G0U691_APHGL|nr:hypothetical protein AGLY_000183 [Aphis glycines]